MVKRKRYTSEEKVKILREVLEEGKSVSGVAETSGVHPNQIMNWRKQMFEGALKTFEIKRTDITEKAFEKQTKAFEDKLRHKDNVIAELAQELLELKKTSWSEIGKRKMSLGIRQLVESEIKRLHTLTGIAILTLAICAGVSRRTFSQWQSRKEVENRHNGHIPRNHWTTPEEETAIIEYCKERMELGYRTLCWQMVDANIAAVSPATVYNMLKRSGLSKKWAKLREDSKKGFDQPEAVHEQWHSDYSYVRVCGNFYYFVSVMDGYSRKILSWGLYSSMEGLWAEVEVTKAKELYPFAKPRIITDNGSQFISKDFKELLSLLEIEHTLTSPGHPQSNGKLERFHRTFKCEHVRQSAFLSFEDANERMESWIRYYNEQRLHGALSYLPPEDVFQGLKEKRLAERRDKMYTALINRRDYWQSLTTDSDSPYKPLLKTASSA
jgi:transposase InsO family protein/transposase-like protein